MTTSTEQAIKKIRSDSDRIQALLAYIEAVNTDDFEYVEEFEASTPITGKDDARLLLFVAIELASELGDQATYDLRAKLARSAI